MTAMIKSPDPISDSDDSDTPLPPQSESTNNTVLKLSKKYINLVKNLLFQVSKIKRPCEDLHLTSLLLLLIVLYLTLLLALLNQLEIIHPFVLNPIT